ncbi:MAG: hypothetical protein IKH78_08205 [Ruminococcus sp.]|uniref:hypothetical protein n=1 Tax=Ralstonia pseudosolanacearum TaxID=1310165 RepID=UPI003D162C81|nr:hypothetical protein [Ruminococcus sp.]
MRVLLVTPKNYLKEIEIGRKFNDLEYVVHGMPMIARKGEDYIVIVSAMAEHVIRNHNEIASALAEAAVYGRAVIIGAKGETWCDLSDRCIEKIHERKARICQLRNIKQSATKRSKGSKPKARSRKEKSSRR